MASQNNHKHRLIQVMAGSEFGGAETAFADTCIALHDAGYEQLVITRNAPTRNQRMRDHGLNVYTLPFGGKLDIYTPYKISRLISQFKPDIVQSWMSRASSKLPKKKGRAYTTVSRLGNYYNLKYFKQTDHFMGITPAICEYLSESGINKDKIHFITNFSGADAGEAPPVNRSDVDTPVDTTVLLTLARYHPAKALDIAIKGLVDLPNCTLWCAGKGPEENALKDLAIECGVSERVKFLGWRNDRAELLKASDICLFISRFEPFGTVFCQAWQNETPVIVSDADGPKQFVRDGEDGLIIPKNDVQALVSAVQKLQRNPNLAQKFVKNGLARYKKEFSKKSTLDAYDALFSKITK